MNIVCNSLVLHILKIKEYGIRSVVGHIIVVTEKGEKPPKFYFSQQRIFFSEKEDLTVNDVRDIGCVGTML